VAKQGNGIQISSKFLVSLSIGKGYEDEIWSDVIPIDACHVLAGPRWLFGRGVLHNGRLNNYTFTKDHRNITLTSLKPS